MAEPDSCSPGSEPPWACSGASTALVRVMLETFAFNEQATRAYRRAGFREIGRRRDAVRRSGAAWDSILMDATAAGFDSPVLGGLRPSE